jgi:hypothetical protein
MDTEEYMMNLFEPRLITAIMMGKGGLIAFQEQEVSTSDHIRMLNQ